MDDLIKSLGVGLILLVIVAALAIFHETEFVLERTFERGLVKVDEDTSYVCQPSERTVKIREAKKILNKTKEGLK